MKTRWGIAGTGRIAGDFARDLMQVPSAELVAVSSRTVEGARTFASRWGASRSHGSIHDIAAEDSLDVVYVAGIHPVHRDHAIILMESGKHVLVEKPLAMNSLEVTEMIDVSRRTGRFLMEAMWMRFNPLHVELKRRLDQGEFGRILSIEADFSFAGPDDPSHRLFDPTKGGGSLLDVGVYPITLAWWYLGEPASWHADVEFGSTGVDVAARLGLEWGNGTRAELHCGTRHEGSRSAIIECEQAIIRIPAPAHSSPIAEIKTSQGIEPVRCAPPGLHHQVDEVHRCIAAGLIESPRMPHSASLSVAKFIDEVLAASRI